VLNESEKAEKWINQALEIQGNDVFALDALFAFYFLEGRLDDLRETGERLAGLAPDLVSGWLAQGGSAYLSSDYMAARGYFEKANQISPFYYGWPGATPFLAQTCLKLGDQEEARRLIDLCRRRVEARLTAGDEGVQVMLNMAVVCAMEGDTSEALDYLQKGMQAGGITLLLWIRCCEPLLTETLSDIPEFQQLMKELESRRDELRRKVEDLEKEFGQ
jgi:tetratricopeptide (TPR) repeat protein